MIPANSTDQASSTSTTAVGLGAILLLPLFSILRGSPPGSLVLVTVAFLVVAVGLALRNASALGWPPWTTEMVLVAGLAVAAGDAFAHIPGLGTDPERVGWYEPLFATALLVCASTAWRAAPRWFRSMQGSALLIVGVAILAIAIYANQQPGIDVWVLRTQGARALAAGDDPYSVLYPNIYGPGTPLVARALLTPDGFWITAYPYMPLTLVLDVLAMLVGDVRWVQVAGIGVSAGALLLLGRGSFRSHLGAALLLLSPMSFLVTELAWTEPALLALVLLTAVAVRSADQRPAGMRSRSTWGLTACGAAVLSSKQYAVLLLLPMLFTLPRARRWRIAATAVAIATIAALPFVAWDPRGFVRGVLEFQLLQPFRPDAISWPAAIAAAGGPMLPTWPAFLAATTVLVLGSRRETTAARSLAIGSLAWMAFIVLNKQAGVNYYWLAGGTLLGAMAANEDTGPATRSVAGQH